MNTWKKKSGRGATLEIKKFPLGGAFCIYRHFDIKVAKKSFFVCSNPANTKHVYNTCTKSANIVQMLYKCFVFTGNAADVFIDKHLSL